AANGAARQSRTAVTARLLKTCKRLVLRFLSQSHREHSVSIPRFLSVLCKLSVSVANIFSSFIMFNIKFMSRSIDFRC
ncbi:MAG: hypothetical protein KDE62_00735, partial [Calditrichaeota bacterium]|nr:hypothetical protein [Calditrichota bacterium]